MLRASTICSAGGYKGSRNNYEPAPFVDCPQFADPLAHRTPPDSSGCDHTDFVVEAPRQTLTPGVYCGGIVINANARADFDPGVYVIKDGELKAHSNAVMLGLGVGFYFAGANASFDFGPGSRVHLEAPVTGDMAGLLFFSDRSQSGSVRNQISSNFVRNMVGTIYLPRAELFIEATERVADQSAYTAIVANRLDLSMTPNLVLNTDYDQTAVPVPDGIRGAGSPIRLVE